MIQLATEVRWHDHRFEVPLERILLSERLGYDAVFTAEGYGSDCLTPLGYIAAHTRKLKLGTRILQITSRAPSMSAMSFQTLDHMAGGGRVIAGLGSATRMASETFHGTLWGSPIRRMRDTVALLRQAFAGQALDHQGPECSAPYRGPDGADFPPAKIGLDVVSEIPIHIAANAPQMTALAAEIGDGWMPSSWAPGVMPLYRPHLEKGFARAGGGKGFEDFQVWGHVDVIADDDVRAAMRPFKEYVVTWSALQRPFMEARGYAETAGKLADLLGSVDISEATARFQAGKTLLEGRAWEEALNVVPDEYIDEGWLVGPVERIGERSKAWFDCGLTGLIVRYGPQLTHDRNVENLAVFEAIARAAGKEPFEA